MYIFFYNIIFKFSSFQIFHKITKSYQKETRFEYRIPIGGTFSKFCNLFPGKQIRSLAKR